MNPGWTEDRVGALKKLWLEGQSASQIAKALEKVAEVRKVSVEDARALGFWHDDLTDENPVPDAQGLVEVPMWRHAVINIPHPLLKQGLVILDTPGLNAVGAEPELTVNLIPQAHAVVFILSADTGVTRSDLSIWREHLAISPDSMDGRLVVLNKIDTLWDTLNSAEQVQAQMERQCSTSAEMLGVPLDRVVPVSAQKGLVAKITADDLLEHPFIALNPEDASRRRLEQELIQQGKRGKSIAGSPIVDCINDLPAIIRELDAAELEIEAAFEGYEDAAQAALRAQQPAQGEAVTEDIAWSDKPLDNELHEHFVSDYGLSNEEAAEAAGDVLSIIAKHAPSQQPADDKLAKAVEALEPLARLELPKKPVGNAGAYSILHTDIRRAKEALAALKTEVK